MSVHATHEALPEKVGSYDVLFPLETGAVTSILVGRVAEPGASPVTIKRIAPAVTHGKDIAAFVARARETPAVAHPNVIGVRDVFQDDDAVCVVMDYLEGETAAAVLRRLAVEKSVTLGGVLAAWIVAEAAAGVEAGHAHGLVHEHLTPHDVFVGHDGHVKLFDGGIARALGELNGSSTIAASELPYAPPERCKGERLDARSDVYSLGAVLWELMTGVSPYERATDADTLRAILAEDPRLPPTSVLRSLPAELSEIALRALDRDPAKRYATVRALREALLGFVEGAGGGEPSASLAILMQNIFAKRIRNNARLLRRADSNRTVAVRSPLAIETPPDPIELERPTVDAFRPVPVDARRSEPELDPLPPEPFPLAETPALAAAVEPAVEPPHVDTVPLELVRVDPIPVEPARVEAVHVEPIAAREDEPVDDGAEEAVAAPPASSRTWIAAVVVLGAVALLGVAWLALRRGGDVEAGAAPAASSAHVVPSSPVVAPIPSSSPPPASSAAETTLKIETVPPKATIVLDGASIGVSPMDVKVPRSDKALVVELRRAGYQPLRESVVPDVDQRLRLVLVPLARAAAPAPPPPPAPTPAPTPSAAPSSPYRRFD